MLAGATVRKIGETTGADTDKTGKLGAKFFLQALQVRGSSYRDMNMSTNHLVR